MDLFFCNNPKMDITQIISRNLKAWMDGNPALSTIAKLSQKSCVGFGTVRRARNGDGNLTVQNLEAIAAAFRRKAADLITETDADGQPFYPMVADNVVQYQAQTPANESLRALIEQAEKLSDEGRWQLVGQAKLMANSYPAPKANHSN